MKRMFLVSLFLLTVMAWAVAQTGSMPQSGGGQATPPSSQAPGAGQTQPATPGSAGQTAPEAGAGATPGAAGGPGGAINTPITEGCLGGSNPNFTVTDSTGTSYKLVIPPGADASSLNAHVGESVQVMGDVNHAGSANAINVTRIGRGTGKCAGAGGQGGAQRPPSK